ncbi:MFS transporter [Nocardia sp. NPDC048505]|uniref:MFS transporter n=1 Tax=Nocardia sp. NPDC048505 TaxID=3155756 RepID=UPI0033DB7005
MPTLLRRPRVLTMWIAQLLSTLGDRCFALAIMWVALDRSGPVVMGAVAIAESIPFVLIGLTGRRLVARAASFPALAGLDAVRAVLVATVLLVWSSGGTAAMLGMVAVLGVCGAIFDPGWGALAPELVADHERAALVALMDLTGRLARIAGPALAGLLLVFAPLTVLFLFDAATFAVSAAALVWLARTGSAAQPGAAHTPGPAADVDARVVLREVAALRTAFGVQGVGFALNALPAIGLPVLLAHEFGVGAAGYGWTLTAAGVAALAGNLAAARLRPEARFPGRFCAAWAASGLLLVATGTAPSAGWAITATACAGFVAPFASISIGTRIAAFPAPQRLRLLQIHHGVMRGAGTAGMAVIPLVIAASAPRGFVIGGAVLTVAAALGWLSRTAS